MKLVFTIPYTDALNIPINEPGWTFVVSQGYLKVYKEAKL